MKPFLDADFLLTTDTAKRLYHACAAKTPILDYHCHIDPQEILEDRKFDNIAQLWLGRDHYKWRQMRWAGVEEKYITGDAPDREKFQKFAEIMPLLAGNPIHHWSHLELQRYFGFTKPLTADTAQEAWQVSGEILSRAGARDLIRQSGVTLLCTTDDPADSLDCHRALAVDDSFPVQVLPAWRPDGAMQISAPGFGAYLARLEGASGVKIDSFAALKRALVTRMDFFNSMGCRTSDHSLDYLMYAPAPEAEVEAIFLKAMSGQTVTEEERQRYLTAFLLFAGAQYARLGWVMQLHQGVMRNCNTKMFRALGPDAGFDAVSNHTPARQAAQFLDALCREDALPKTVLYSLNPGDFTTLASVLGCFQTGEAAGKLQLGSAWWFHDTKTGMIEQMTALANQGALGTFIGMLTDSRSFVSYPRHEYFRRILCELVGGWVENGEYPGDEEALFRLIRGICYDNAVGYFGFSL